jgi:PPOX class probable F420-dependent enzyme
MNPSERRDFVRAHRTAVLGYARRDDGPAMSIVYYVMEDDDTILVSTMGERAKAKAAERLGKVSLCVLDEQWPPTYLQVYCDADVVRDADLTVDVMMRVAGVMAGAPLDESVRPLVAQGAEQEGRVVLRLRPYATFETPPRHVHSEADINESLTHWTSSSLPWAD